MVPRIRMCCLPTPCHKLERLGSELGLDLWIKRDDLTGFGAGGNKGRKLEYLIAAALDAGADRLVTCGSRQSNFVRQLGAACAVHGFACTAAVMTLPYDQAEGKPTGLIPESGGNVVLDELFGVELREYPDGDWLDLFSFAEEIAAEYEAKGEAVFRVPVGGSSPLGAYSFAQAAVEVGEGWDFVVVPTSSGSTHAGLAWAFHGSRTKVIGISCDPEDDLKDDLVRLATGIDGLSQVPKSMERDDFDIRKEWVGAGYNVPSPEGEAALLKMARSEGIVLDPVYSAKAFAGLLGLAARGDVHGRTLFWHTGGLPTVLAGRRPVE
ncbi:MAG: pyridoxal-phosphate dependent enzyme [Armatimonadetes bacterium]|nr:pyridoxal-phosphate dependent enzyme [Armatimonadota bacterium]